MASGTLGAAVIAANTDTKVYTCPSGAASINFNVVNRTQGEAVVNVAITQAALPADADYIEYGVTIPGGGILERSALVVGAGDQLFVRASVAGCTVRVYGFEE